MAEKNATSKIKLNQSICGNRPAAKGADGKPVEGRPFVFHAGKELEWRSDEAERMVEAGIADFVTAGAK